MIRITKNKDCISDIDINKKAKKNIDNISNASSSHIQSSSNTLILNKEKKNSFFSMLNNEIRKENFFSSNNLNTPNSNFFTNNIIVEENAESPNEKRFESGNKISKFSLMKINGLGLLHHNKSNDNTEEIREIDDSDLENEIEQKKNFEKSKEFRSLKPRKRNLSIEYKITDKKRKSAKDNSEEIIKKWKNEIRKNFIKNGNNISIIDEYDENLSKKDDS